MRDKVIHDYLGIDIALVWNVATTMQARLRADVQAILNKLRSPSGGGCMTRVWS
jgi:uncharacterized protein with HEPN domain